MFHLRVLPSPITEAIMSKIITTGFRTRDKSASRKKSELLESTGVARQPKAAIIKKAEKIPFDFVKKFASFSFIE